MTTLDPRSAPDHLGLMTDLYELRMAQTYLGAGMTGEASFSLYIRPSPERPWFVTAGLHRLYALLDRFRYGDAEIDYLAEGHGFSDDFLGWLSELQVTGRVVAVPDGTVVLGDEPLLEITAPLPVGQLLETAIMNVMHFSTVVATKAARCVVAAEGRLLADFGARRAHGIEAAVEAARAAYLAGFDATSNVEAGRRFGIPVAGTMAHSLIQAYDDEVQAFRAFARDHPGNATLLVDTYDTLEGVEAAIAVGRELQERGEELNGIRLDSGDLAGLAVESRRKLDAAGFEGARIFASGGIDEWRIAELVGSGAPIDAFGVGTGLTTSRDRPAEDIAYKLVEYDGRARAKYSEGKVLRPGRKQVFRSGGPDTDVMGTRDDELEGDVLLLPAWRDGQRLLDVDLADARDRAAAQLERLPAAWRHPDGPEEAPRPRISPALEELTREVRKHELG